MKNKNIKGSIIYARVSSPDQKKQKGNRGYSPKKYKRIEKTPNSVLNRITRAFKLNK